MQGLQGVAGPTGATGTTGAPGATGATGAAGLSVTSVVDRITGPAGLSVTSVPESSLTALPPGATTRRVMVLNALLRTDPAELPPILGVFHAFIAPNPATGTVFTGAGSNVVPLYIVSYFSY